MTLGNALTDARCKAGMTQPEAVGQLGRLDAPMLSRIEHGRCMPMRVDLESLCELYGMPYPKALTMVAAEYGLKCPKKADKPAGASLVYKFDKRMPRELATTLLAILREEGYQSIQDWFDEVVRRKISRAKKKAAASSANTDSSKQKTTISIVNEETEDVKC